MNKLYKDPGELDKIAGLNKTSVFRIGGLLAAIVGGATVVAWLFTGSNANTSTHSVSNYSAQQPEPLTVLDWDWETFKSSVDGKTYIAAEKNIVGRVKNNSSKQYSYVQIEFNLYDIDDNHIGTAMTNTNNLEPNSIWKFKSVPLMVGTANVNKAKLKSVSGY